MMESSKPHDATETPTTHLTGQSLQTPDSAAAGYSGQAEITVPDSGPEPQDTASAVESAGPDDDIQTIPATADPNTTSPADYLMVDRIITYPSTYAYGFNVEDEYPPRVRVEEPYLEEYIITRVPHDPVVPEIPLVSKDYTIQRNPILPLPLVERLGEAPYALRRLREEHTFPHEVEHMHIPPTEESTTHAPEVSSVPEALTRRNVIRRIAEAMVRSNTSLPPEAPAEQQKQPPTPPETEA